MMNSLERERLVAGLVIALGLVVTWITMSFIVSVWRIVRGRIPVVKESLVSRIAFRALALVPIATLTHVAASHAATTVGPSESPDVAPAVDPFDNGSEALTNLLLGGAIGAGVLSRVRARNASDLRRGEDPNPVAMAVESELAREAVDLAVERLDAAVRMLGDHSREIVMVVVTPSGDLRAEMAVDTAATGCWRRIRPRLLELGSGVPTEMVLSAVRPDSPRPPVLFSVGSTTAGEVFINIEAVGEFVLEGSGGVSDDVWRGLSESLALSPFAENVTFIGDPLVGRRVFVAPDPHTSRRFSESIKSTGDVSIVIDADGSSAETEVPRLGRGSVEMFGLRVEGGRCSLMPSGVEISPVGCDLAVQQRIGEAVGEVEHVKIHPEPVPAEIPPSCVPAHSFVVSVIGAPEIRHTSGSRVRFEKSKSEELVIWLATHSSSRRRSLARDAMWSVPVRDSTFCNVTSDARRSLSAHEISDGSQWVGVTGNDEIPLHERIISDIEIVRLCVDHARRWPEDDGINILKYALRLVRGIPFAGSGYVWPDTAAMASDVVVLVSRAAQLCADLCSDEGDDDGVMWATARGLEVIPGHEGLVSTRLRHLAAKGSPTEVRREWESYCRVLARDNWGDAGPPRAMCELFNSLIHRQT